MNRTLVGALCALLLVAVGVFWWQGRAEQGRRPATPPPAGSADDPDEPVALPSADAHGQRGPKPPEMTEADKEELRFSRLDRNRDGRISREEMMATRTAAFRKLDRDGNNLLTFEEWAVTTANRFKQADANGDLSLTPVEFATTRPKTKHKAPTCKC